jgi:hypothetical protein
MRVIIGKPFSVATDGLDRRHAIDAAVNQVEAALRALLPQYQGPQRTSNHFAF